MQQLSAEAEKSLPASGSKYGGSIANDGAFVQLSQKLEDLTSRFERLEDALSTKIDPEELRKLLSAYHRSVTGVLAGFDGFVARYGRWWAGLFRLSAGA